MNEDTDRVVVNRKGEAWIESMDAEKQSVSGQPGADRRDERRSRPRRLLKPVSLILTALLAAVIWIMIGTTDDTDEIGTRLGTLTDGPSTHVQTAAITLGETHREETDQQSSGVRQEPPGGEVTSLGAGDNRAEMQHLDTLRRVTALRVNAQNRLQMVTDLSDEGDFLTTGLVIYHAYDCPYSRENAQVVDHFLRRASSKARRINYRFGMLDKRTEPLALASIGVAGDVRWPAFHVALVSNKIQDGDSVDDFLQRSADDAGLDRERLERNMGLAKTKAILDHHAELAKEDDVEVYPSYFVSGNAVDLHDFLHAFDGVSIDEVNRAAKRLGIF